MVNTNCKVEKSPYCSEYERLWKEENYNFKRLEEIASIKYNEKISAMTFHRHMTQHLILREVQEIPEKIEVDNQDISEDPLISLKISLEELNSIIGIAKKIFEKRPSPPALTSLTNAYDKKRSILESIEKLERAKKANTATSERVVLEELLWASEFLCPQCMEKLSKVVTERLKKIGAMETNTET